MKQPVEQREPKGALDHVAMFLTTWGVGYLPLAPGTWGSMVGVAIYFGVSWIDITVVYSLIGHGVTADAAVAIVLAINAILLTSLILLGIWASGRTIAIFGNSDPSEAVVDELMGQLITLLVLPMAASWPLVLAGFLLFRLFDIWKPFPIRTLEMLPGGLGICADDIVAGIYAGVCLSAIYAFTLLI
jgi:phosphatidylglycerophosphatase A